MDKLFEALSSSQFSSIITKLWDLLREILILTISSSFSFSSLSNSSSSYNLLKSSVSSLKTANLVAGCFWSSLLILTGSSILYFSSEGNHSNISLRVSRLSEIVKSDKIWGIVTRSKAFYLDLFSLKVKACLWLWGL